MQRITELFETYLKFERNFTDNTAMAYVSDITKLENFLADRSVPLEKAGTMEVEAFLVSLHELGISPESQARILQGIKAFYRFLLSERYIDSDPCELIEAPKKRQHIPTVLTLDEVNRVISMPDVSTALGQRNRAILETLYSCGLRVSELIDLRFSRIFAREGYIIVVGKGRKERLVPISESALQEIENYRAFRYETDVQPGFEDCVFLNRFGRAMTRIAVFNVVKQYCAEAGIRKDVSPHTFRHTFATHLLEGGANLRAIQMMLGHAQISTTQIYTKADIQHLREDILMYHPRNKV